MLQLDFSLSPHAALPLYEQIYRHISAQIRTGALPTGSRLPGKRSLAAELGVSVNTVDTAYQLLLAEGYLASRPRSGFVVLAYADRLTAPPAPPAPPVTALPAPRFRFDLSTGGVDPSLFPFRTWGRIQKELLYSSPELLAPGHSQGDANLRQVLAEYLRAYRGVACTPEQIVVGAGMEYLTGLLAGLLPGSRAAVENPGYPRAAAVLQNSGAACVCVPVDEGGLAVDALEASGANLCYITPSHQFPTGVTMPASRRAQLLHWARSAPGRYILEDDYDSEFRYDVRPLPSLQGMAGPDGPVVYLATLSRSLAPSIRMAYMVLPPALLAQYRARYALYSSTVSRFEQQTLCRFVREGHFVRHLARLRKACRARRDALTAALTAQLAPGSFHLGGQPGGLHLLLALHTGPDESRMVARAAAAGVRLGPLSAYYMQDAAACPPRTVVLGYGALPASAAAPASAALAKAWQG